MNRTSAQLTSIQALSPEDWAARVASSSDFKRASALEATWACRATEVNRKKHVFQNTGEVLLWGKANRTGVYNIVHRRATRPEQKELIGARGFFYNLTG
jgi:hypothetical protein